MRCISAAGTRRRRSSGADTIVNDSDLAAVLKARNPRMKATISVDAPPSTVGSQPRGDDPPSRWGVSPAKDFSSPSTVTLPSSNVTAMTWPRMAVTVVIALLDAIDVTLRLAESTLPSALDTAWSVIMQGTRDARGMARIFTSVRLKGTLNLTR